MSVARYEKERQLAKDYNDAKNRDQNSDSDKVIKNKERNSGVENEGPNNWAVFIGDSKKPWKVFASAEKARAIVKTLKAKGKTAVAVETAAKITEAKDATFVIHYSIGNEKFDEEVQATALLQFGPNKGPAAAQFIKEMDPKAKFISVSLKESKIITSNIDKLLEKLTCEEDLNEGFLGDIGDKIKNIWLNNFNSKPDSLLKLSSHFYDEMMKLKTPDEIKRFLSNKQDYIRKHIDPKFVILKLDNV